MPIRSSADARHLELTPLRKHYPQRTLYDIFTLNAERYGEQAALRFLHTAEPGGPEDVWSHNKLLQGIHQTANLLSSLGIGKDDAVAVMLPGCLEYQLVLWGGACAGIVSPLNPLLSEEVLVELISAAKAKVLVAWGGEGDSEYWTKALTLGAIIPGLTLVRVAPSDEICKPSEYLPEGVVDFHDGLEGQPADRLCSGRQIEPEDVAAYFHTGGTTGAPKMAKHTHAGQVFSAWAYSTMQGMDSSERVVGGFPLFHTAGVLPGALSSLFAGVELIIPTTTLMRNPGLLRNYWKLSAYHQVTSVSGPPTFLSALTSIPLDGEDLSRVTGCRTGSAAIPAELAGRFHKLFGMRIQESYGMTEMTGLSSITPAGVICEPGCAGITIPFGRYRIVHLGDDGAPSDREVVQGDVGMILYKGPNVFAGYLDEQATRKTFTSNGWLITGDLGYVDDRDMLHVTGRAKDLIIRSGHNIDPKMIEDAMSQHPEVVLSAAVGAPDAYAGELPVLYVTLKEGAAVTSAELLEFVAERVHEAPAKPKWVTIVETMPLTNVAKIFKPALRLKAAEEAVCLKVSKMASEACEEPSVTVSAVFDDKGRVVVDLQVAGISARLKSHLDQELERMPVRVVLA